MMSRLFMVQVQLYQCRVFRFVGEIGVCTVHVCMCLVRVACVSRVRVSKVERDIIYANTFSSSSAFFLASASAFLRFSSSAAYPYLIMFQLVFFHSLNFIHGVLSFDHHHHSLA